MEVFKLYSSDSPPDFAQTCSIVGSKPSPTLHAPARQDRAPSPSDTEELRAGKSAGKTVYYQGLDVWESLEM